MNKPTMEALAERLNRVERYAKWAIGISVLLAVVVAGQSVKGQRETLEVKKIKAEQITATSVTTESTMAQFFFVTDGTPTGVFGAKLMNVPQDTPALTFYDKTGMQRLTLGLQKDGSPRLTLADADGGVRATVGSTTMVYSRTGLEEKWPESTIALFNKDGKVIWRAP